MRDLTIELKGLRLHGMASAWSDLLTQGATSTESSKWLIEHLLQAENTDRAMRSVSHQMNAAKFPVHRDLAGFDFASSKVDQPLVKRQRWISRWLNSWRLYRLPSRRRTRCSLVDPARVKPI